MTHQSFPKPAQRPPKRRKGLKRQSDIQKAFEEELGALRVEWTGRPCELCRREGFLIHHILRRGQRGKNNRENLMWLCGECHDYIHSHIAESYERGWLVRNKT